MDHEYILDREIFRIKADIWDRFPSNPPPCPYCEFTYVHRHDCLEIMNRMRIPDGDWWKI